MPARALITTPGVTANILAVIVSEHSTDGPKDPASTLYRPLPP